MYAVYVRYTDLNGETHERFLCKTSAFEHRSVEAAEAEFLWFSDWLDHDDIKVTGVIIQLVDMIPVIVKELS